MKRNISVRLDEDLVREVDELADMENIDRSQLLRYVFKEGLQQHRLELAVNRYAESELTVSEAAALAEVAVGEFMDTLVERGIQANLSPDELEDSLEHARTHLTDG